MFKATWRRWIQCFTKPTAKRKLAPNRLFGVNSGKRTSNFERLEVREVLASSTLAAASLPAVTMSSTSTIGLVSSPASYSSPTGEPFLSLPQEAQAYGINAIPLNGTVGSGAGQTIAIIDSYGNPYIYSDLINFDAEYSIPAAPSFQVENEHGMMTQLPGVDSDGGWELEEALDVEVAHALAPSANIILYEEASTSFSDFITALQTARSNSAVSVVSMSFGFAEGSNEASYDSYFTTPAGHQGITYLAASGDENTGSSSYPPAYPATSPNVVGVGGTTLAVNGSNNWLSEVAWSVTGPPAAGSAGGFSEYETRPAYQNSVSTNAYRAAPDVSADAAGVWIYDAYNYGTTDPWGGVGGTSAAAPAWASMVAVADQARATIGLSTLDGPSQTLPYLYELETKAPSDFHDITVGSNLNGEYSATGYDEVTGIGSPVANTLVPMLAGVSTTISVSASQSTIAYGQSDTLTATVYASGASPPSEGTVTFSANGVVLGSSPVTTGVATLSTTTLASGQQTITASYSDSANNNFYVASSTTPGASSHISTAAGNGNYGYSGDGGQATAAELFYSQDIAFDSAGDMFIADSSNNRIREVNHSSGTITTIGGNGAAGFTGDGGQATAAEISHPLGIAVDAAGNVYFVDGSNQRVREINHSTGIISTIAGTGTAGYNGDSIQATAALLNAPEGVALDGSGDLFIADSGNNRIREIVLSTGVITTVAGTGVAGYGGDGGQATAAKLNGPEGIALNSAGDIFITDSNNYRVREVNRTTGVITTVAGNGANGFTGDGGAGTAAELGIADGIVVDSQGDIIFADEINDRIREVSHSTGVISTIVGNGVGGFLGDGGLASSSEIHDPAGLALDSLGNLYIADQLNLRIREVGAGPVVVVEPGPNSQISTVAGYGGMGYSGDGGQATAAELSEPLSVAKDSAGDLFIADELNNRVREVNYATGLITTVAGNGTYGYSGDGGQATAAELRSPTSVAVNSAGILFIYDSNNYRIREVNLSTGVITTVAGNGTGGYSGDGGQATTAEINAGWAIALDSAGDLFIADGNNRIREVNQSTGIISTVAGNGTSGYSGDGGQATAAEIGVTWAMTLDAAGDIFISTNNRIREVKHSTGVISTVAGNGTSGFSGDGGSATAAELFQAQGLAVDPLGDLFIADTDNNRIREVNATTGVITTIAGNGTPGNIGDGGKASAAELHQPVGLLLDAFGNLFVADSSNEKIRKIT